jgi:hypothetical protein
MRWGFKYKYCRSAFSFTAQKVQIWKEEKLKHPKVFIWPKSVILCFYERKTKDVQMKRKMNSLAEEMENRTVES